MDYKLLVSYDIVEQDESKRCDVEEALKSKGRKWVHLQRSVWVVMDGDAKISQENLLNIVPNSSVAVVDITKKQVFANKFVEAGNEDRDKEILSSSF